MKRPTQDGITRPLFPAEPFEGFGPSRFRAAEDALVAQGIRTGQLSKLLRGVKDHAPRIPGVYGMYDRSGRLIYVGKAKCLRARLLSYFRVKSRDPKAGRILGQTRYLVWEQTADEFSALLRELELIQQFRPKFNVMGQPGNARYHYVCLGKTPAPYAYIAREPTGKELGVYGPLMARTRSEDAVRRINDWFKLRDCPSTVPLSFTDQPEIFPTDRSPGCLRFELATCAGPCVGACSRKDYGAGVRGAKSFLDGRSAAILATIRALMLEAANEFQFEKAMALRDRLAAFEWLDARLSLLRKARHQHSFIYPLEGHDGQERWYLIHRGQVQHVVLAPRNAAQRRRTRAALKATFTDAPISAVIAAKVVDSVLLVAAWFRKNEEHRCRLITGTEALGKCA